MIREIRKNVRASPTQLVSLFLNVLEAVESLNVMFSFSFVLLLDHVFKFGVNLVICDSDTVLKMLHDLRTDKASTSDNIPLTLLKVTANDICAP